MPRRSRVLTTAAAAEDTRGPVSASPLLPVPAGVAAAGRQGDPAPCVLVETGAVAAPPEAEPSA